jgi:hypothetical protein
MIGLSDSDRYLDMVRKIMEQSASTTQATLQRGPVDRSVPNTNSQPNFNFGAPTSGSSSGLSPAEQWIIQRESSGRTNAQNPTSSAFGLGQLLIGNRTKYARQFGFSPNTTDYGQQLAMFRAYVRDRYGTPEAAQRFWQQHHWY